MQESLAVYRDRRQDAAGPNQAAIAIASSGGVDLDADRIGAAI